MANGISTWWMARREKCPPISRNSEVDRGSAGHAEIVIGRADKTAGDGNRLTDVTGDRNAYQVIAADRPVRWVVGNPAGTWQIDISPCVCRAGACYGRGGDRRHSIASSRFSGGFLLLILIDREASSYPLLNLSLAVLPLDRLFSIADLLGFEVGVLVPSFLDNCLLPLFDPIQHSYSITSSASVSTLGGISRPSVLAVLRFMTGSNLIS